MKLLLASVLFQGTLLLAGGAFAQSPREQLNQLTAQLRANPADQALRERIIKLAQEIKPPPAIPEEARRHFVIGNTLQRDARGPKDASLAIPAYQQALEIAPWWGNTYYNLAVAQELAGRFDNAAASFRLYLMTNPPAAEARETQDRIYALEAKKKLAAAAQSTPEAAAERERGLLANLSGAVWITPVLSTAMDPGLNRGRTVRYGRNGFMLRGNQLHMMSGVGWWPGEPEPAIESGGVLESFTIAGTRSSVIANSVPDPSCNPIVVQISDDGSVLSTTSRCYRRVNATQYTRRP